MNIDLTDDSVLLFLVSTMLDAVDPIPPAALRAATAAGELQHVDSELVMLAAEAAGGQELFRDDRGHTALTFRCDQLAVEIEIDTQGYAVGVLSPPAVTTVAIEVAARPGSPEKVTCQTDELGRFQVQVGHGLCRLVIGTGADAVATSWFYG
jgi:hypothetical protein